MKKRKINNYFKFGILLIGILFLLSNCENDIEIIDLVENNQRVGSPIKNLTLEEALNDIKFTPISILLNLTKRDIAHKNSQDEVIYIDTKNIIKIIKKDYITYTFLVINKKQENKNSFTNLIVEQTHNKMRGYLAYYIPTNEYLYKKAKGIKTPFHGTVSFSPFTEDIKGLLSDLNKKINTTSKNNLQSRISDCYYQTVTIETSCASREHWPGDNCTLTGSDRASTRYVEALICGDGGGGSGIIYEYQPIYIGENEIIGIGGGDGTGYIPPSGSTYPNLPAEITDLCDTGYQNVNGECVEDDKIINNLTGKSSCVYEKLQNNNILKKTLEKFVGEKTPVHLIINEESNLRVKDENGNYVIVNGVTSYGTSYYITITLNTEQANNRPSLAVARTILHEAIHAEIYREIKITSGMYFDSSNNEWRLPDDSRAHFPTLFDNFNEDPNNPHHHYMANYYRTALEDGLKEYAALIGETHSDQFYKDFVWNGLLETKAWKNQFSDPVYAQNEKIRIINVISNYENSRNNECQ